VPPQLGDQLGSAGRPRQVGGDERAAKGDSRGERLLDEPDSFDQGEAAPAARLAALEIADRRLQITGDEAPRRCRANDSICEEAWEGRYVKIALTIAGSDSGGGAGIQADLKTFHQFGVFGTSVVTAVTAQNTLGVRAWEAVPVQLVMRQLDAVVEDLPPVAVKSGMLGASQVVDAVADGIARRSLPNYVLDPVMVATSGDRLLDADAERLMARRLVPLASLVTPNLDEAEVLVGDQVRTPEGMERAARALVRMGARAALVKGGHLPGADIVDVLVSDGIVRRFTRPRLDTTSTHGTGCTLSAAITAGLALDRPLERAVQDALDFVQRAMAAAPALGAGHGPLNHFVPAPPRPPTDGW
jgi:hydroxymethylpyrimidine/phosphomethylpyrimidine kinase